MKPKTLQPVSETDYVEAPGWSSEIFVFEDEESWRASIHRCYNKVPYDQLKKFRFVMMPDTQEQISVKTEAVETAFHFVMDKYKENYSSDENYEKYHYVFQSMMYHFFACLLTFHPLTMSLKTRDFTKIYSTACMTSCPFGRGAEIWREHYGLKYLTGKIINVQCSCNKPQQFAAMKYHLQREDDNFYLHQSVHKYLHECQRNLAKHYSFWIDQEDYTTQATI